MIIPLISAGEGEKPPTTVRCVSMVSFKTAAQYDAFPSCTSFRMEILC